MVGNQLRRAVSKFGGSSVADSDNPWWNYREWVDYSEAWRGDYWRPKGKGTGYRPYGKDGFRPSYGKGKKGKGKG